MKNFISLLIAVGLTLISITASAESSWVTDYKKAQEDAKAGKKLMLLEFTGSDWCGWCMKLDKEVFSTPEFQNYASRNLILVKLDFPRRRPQTEALKKQNEQLAQKYGIQGFPTIIVLNGQGEKVGELGYMEGGPSPFLAKLETLPKS
ncbi:MAG TPA: thioredoxin fold domain-containing protein [Chthoniobacterales bacterium]